HGGLGVDGRKTAATAMAWGKSREQAKIRYFKPGEGPFAIAGAGYARFYVLGPPREVKLLKKSDPTKKHSEVYELAAESAANHAFCAAVESLEEGKESEAQPFSRWFKLTEQKSRTDEFFTKHYWSGDDSWRQIEHDWLSAAGTLALQLDSDTNNTC